MPILNTDNRILSLTDKFTRDITLLGQAFNAEQEWHNIKNNQAQGIAVAKKVGIQFGRPKLEYPENFSDTYNKWKNKEITPATAMEILGLKKTNFYKMVKEFSEERGEICPHRHHYPLNQKTKPAHDYSHE